MTSENQNIATALRFYDYINRRVASDWANQFAPNWEATPSMPSMPDQLAGYCSVIDGFRSGAPDLAVEQLEVVSNEDVVAIRSQVSGTHTGELFGVPATGRTFAFTAMDIHRLSEGKIAATWHAEDFGGLMKQLLEPLNQQMSI